MTMFISDLQPFRVKNLFLLVLILAQAQNYMSEDEPIDLLNHGTYVWDGYKTGYPTSLCVTAASYSISVVIVQCDIGYTPNRNSYLTIMDGTDEEFEEGLEGRIFVHIKKPRQLYFFTSKVCLELSKDDVGSKLSDQIVDSCKVEFSKGEEITTTTEAPTTPASKWPTPGPKVDIDYVVHISGKTSEEYKDPLVEINLKQMFVAMAMEYISGLQNFNIIESITVENILIEDLEQCPINWPNNDTCVTLKYAIPVILDESSMGAWGKYQFTAQHLDIMWKRLASKNLGNGLSVYREPEIDRIVTWWILAVILVTLAFVILIVVGRIVATKLMKGKRSNTSHSDNSRLETRKSSNTSLRPHYKQAVPPMFDNSHSSDPEYYEIGSTHEGLDNPVFELDEDPYPIESHDFDM